MSGNDMLIVGGYGEVGRRLAAELETAHPGHVVVAGRNPRRASALRARPVDIDDPSTIEAALDGVSTVVACVRQREPHLLHTTVRRGLAYTSIAPPWLPWPLLAELHMQAQRTGARIVLAAGIEPGISSVLARLGADRIGKVDAVKTALLLGVGDVYGPDSMGFIFDEIVEPYTVVVDGREEVAFAFAKPTHVTFPAPIGVRRAYTMAFRDQLYYPTTLGAKTAVARLALDPPWIADVIATLLRIGARAWLKRRGGRGAMRGVIERLRRRYTGRDHFGLVVEVWGGGRSVRSTLIGRGQAQATAVAAAAIVEALYAGEVREPGVWLAEQIIPPAPFLARLAAHGLVPSTEAVSEQ